MKNFKLLLLMSLALMVSMTACDDDDPDPTYDKVEVNAPAPLTLATDAQDQSVTFSVSFDSELTAEYTASGIGVTVENTSGTVNGSEIVVNFDVGSNPGAASITVVVTDSEGDSDEATALINVTDESVMRLTSNISSNTTWTSDKTYILGGRITVLDGVTLEIEPGTIIKGEAGTGANATALLVARGATIMAEGTANAPIIFTSVADEITPEDVAAGNFESPNLDPDINGLWGGVIVLGKARISASNDNNEDVSEVQIEGIPTSDPNGLYGGSDDNDNSGVIRYISIRHGGTNIGSGNEINGLTLGGVGSGTTIEHVEVVANQDDGVEWFGGTVNVDNVVVWNVGDDGIDTDQAWAGTLNNFVVVTVAGHSFELDGPEGTYNAGHTIMNGSVIASNSDRVSQDLINVDDNSNVTLRNLFFTGIMADQGINRITAAEVEFDNVILDVPSANLSDYVPGDTVPQGIVAGTTPQADVSVFGWTWTSRAGALAEIQ